MKIRGRLPVEPDLELDSAGSREVCALYVCRMKDTTQDAFLIELSANTHAYCLIWLALLFAGGPWACGPYACGL